MRILTRDGSRCAPGGSRGHRSFEKLEPRFALTGAPTVVDVTVASTDWDSGFVSHLEDNGLGIGGYSIPVGSVNQFVPLSWSNINQVKITFSEDVNVQAADLSLTGFNIQQYHFSDFSYDPQTQAATWTLITPLTRDALLIDLDANGIDPVVDLEGNVLDGEWTDKVSTFPTGNGSAGGDFEFRLNALPGDIVNYGIVSSADHQAIQAKQGLDVDDASYVPQFDLDGDGVIDSDDVDFVFDHLNEYLPWGAPAGVQNDAPTTSGLGHVDIDDATADVVISLWDSFHNLEDAVFGLTHSVVSNSNPGLFDGVSVNNSQGTLRINAASGASGRAEIVVKATDSDGLSVFGTLHVDVDYENQAPQITEYYASFIVGNGWRIQGKVSDPDDDVKGWLVEVSGVITERVAVAEDGRFSFVEILDPDDIGWVYAFVTDPHGAESIVVQTFVGF